MQDIEVKGAWEGPAVFELFRHSLAAVAALWVRRVVGSAHIPTDMTLGPGQVVYSCLTT